MNNLCRVELHSTERHYGQERMRQAYARLWQRVCGHFEGGERDETCRYLCSGLNQETRTRGDDRKPDRSAAGICPSA